MSKIVKRLPKGKDILYRIGALETELDSTIETVENLAHGIDRVFASRDKAFGRMDEMVRALISLAGEENVLAAINAARTASTEKAASAAFGALEASRASGVAVLSETVTDQSLLVVEQYKADGTPDVPAKIPVSVLSIGPELLAQALGKGVGTRVVNPSDGDYLIISEIYVIDETRAMQLEAEALEKAAEEAAELTGADAQ